MNSTLELMYQHRSIRAYQDKAVPSDVLNSVLKAAWHGPTSVNGQQVSLVVVEDAARRQKIAEIAGGQPWIAQAPVFIAVVADFYKTGRAVAATGSTQVIHDSLEGFTVGAIDAGITLGNLMTAARAAGLSVVPIGGIRNDPTALATLLHLPEHTFPMVGVCLGYAAKDAPLKPRLPLSTYVHKETYQADGLDAAITAYDQTMMAHWQAQGRDDGEPWTISIRDYYSKVYFPNLRAAASKQGFGFDQ